MLARPRVLIAAGAFVVLSVVTAVVWRFAIFILPFSWTGEATALAERLRVKPGSVVADIGAGDGTLAFELGRRVGSGGTVYATEIDPARLGEIAKGASRAGLTQVRLVQGDAEGTRLPERCCDAVYMRTVFHHIGRPDAFAREVKKTLRAGGRVAVIDFPPGSLWFHGDNHGVAASNVIQAFERAGLTRIEQVDDWGGGTYFLLFELESAHADDHSTR